MAQNLSRRIMQIVEERTISNTTRTTTNRKQTFSVVWGSIKHHVNVSTRENPETDKNKTRTSQEYRKKCGAYQNKYVLHR